MGEKLGKINKIMRFPIKGMKGENMQEVFVGFSGLIGDRIYAIRDKNNTSNFPWFTARQKNDLILYQPAFKKKIDIINQYPDANDFAMTVKSPKGKVYEINDPSLIEELEDESGKNLELRFSQAGMHDSRPVSILGVQTLEKLEEETGLKIDSRRFRMNFNIKWENNKPFYEEELIGKKLRIGDDLVIEITKKDARCFVITLDPDSAESKIEILKHIAKQHGGCFGVYAVVIKEGIAKQGDNIYLE